MKNLRPCILIVVISVITSTAAAQVMGDTPEAKPGPGKPLTSISISAFHDPVKLGSPVTVIVTLTNTSNEDIQFGRLLSGADSKIDVRDLNGNLLPDTRFGYIHNGHVPPSQMDPNRVSVQDLKDGGVGVTVKAGQSTTWGIVVTRFYVVTMPGKYNIHIERADPGNPTTIVKSNKIVVTVTP